MISPDLFNLIAVLLTLYQAWLEEVEPSQY